jgi:hypothetical protein
VRGYLALADKTVTGYREPSARYREADSLERVGRACVLVVRVAPEGRRLHGPERHVDRGLQLTRHTLLPITPWRWWWLRWCVTVADE